MKEKNKEKNDRRFSRKNPVFTGIILIIIGLFLVLGRFIDFGQLKNFWPLLLLVPVVPIAQNFFKDTKANADSLVQLTVLVLLAVYFIWLNLNSWESVSKTWPNFIIIPGLGMLFSWLINRKRSQLISSLLTLATGFLLYGYILLGGLSFYMTLGIVFILAGILKIVFKDRRIKRKKLKNSKESSNEQDESAETESGSNEIPKEKEQENNTESDAEKSQPDEPLKEPETSPEKETSGKKEETDSPEKKPDAVEKKKTGKTTKRGRKKKESEKNNSEED